MMYSQRLGIFVAWLCCMLGSTAAYSQCPSCTITLPSTLPADTVYLDSFPNARKGSHYEQSISFRFPYTSTPLATLQPGTPSGITLQSFTITGISGLPLGLSWAGDRSPMVYAETAPNTRDGCIMICGTPQQSGTFIVDVSVLATIPVLGSQPATIPIEFIVEPDTSAGFVLDTSRGCAPLTVTAINRIPQLGNEVWTYAWDFGDGTTSTLQNPPAVTYADSGTYQVSLQAISTLTLPRAYLNSITVTSASCGDVLGRPDLYVTIGTAGGAIDTVTNYVLNTNPPIVFDFAQDVVLNVDSMYRVFVQDDDAPTSGPDDCGSIYFSADTTASIFTLTSGSLTATIRLTRDTLYQIDTVNTTDFVVVLDCDTATSIRQTVSEDIAINVYPNPTKDEVNVSFDLSASANDVYVSLYDALGRVVSQEVWNGQSQYNRTMTLGQYGAGMYILQVRSGNQQWTRKIVVLE